MYKKILVPLDGSELAECVLPHVESVVRGCHVPDIIFLRVVEPSYFPTSATDLSTTYTKFDAKAAQEKTDTANKAEAESYVNSVSERFRYGDARNQGLVLMGKPADTIADYAEQNGVDLIVIATHGRSGVSRWMWGSTTDKVLRSACVPMLMVRAPGCVPGF